jgi:hypothetical protein
LSFETAYLLLLEGGPSFDLLLIGAWYHVRFLSIFFPW